MDYQTIQPYDVSTLARIVYWLAFHDGVLALGVCAAEKITVVRKFFDLLERVRIDFLDTGNG